MRSLPRNWSRSVRTRSSIIQVLVAVQVITSLTLLLHSASFQLESILNSESILKAQMSSASGASTVHRRFACMGCTARRGEPTFFNDYQSAATHYSRSIHCNKSMRGIKAVTVQLNTRPSTLAMAWPEPVERLASGAPNPPHPAAPQVP